mgnify:CR=1 FL=1
MEEGRRRRERAQGVAQQDQHGDRGVEEGRRGGQEADEGGREDPGEDTGARGEEDRARRQDEVDSLRERVFGDSAARAE